jgi:anaerobic magnesium-protoporphyrin IX monomethyl ester cyclase
MRTLLIMPPYPITEFPTIPMGLAYVAAALRKECKEVQVEDFLVGQYSKEKLRRRIKEYKPDIVGITSVTLNYPAASAILTDVKKIDDNIITVFGGPHATFTAEQTLMEEPWVDIVARGESDYTLVDIVNGMPLREVGGISFRENGQVVSNPLRPWIENLDELAEPARDLFPVAKYRALGNECGVTSSRGCPFHCAFCVGHKMVGRKGRFRNPKLVVDEIEGVLEMGFRTINIVDDLLTINKKHVYAICDELLERNLNIRWTAFSRVDTVDKELFTRMKEAGCFFVLYGVESGNQQILDNMHKKITPEKVKWAVELARECEIRTLASFIIGLPGETKETLKETVSFAKSLNTHYGFHLLSPFPGTEVRERAEEFGMRILTDDWSRYDANEAIVEYPDVRAEDLLAIDRQYKADIDRYIQKLEELKAEGRVPEYDGDLMHGQKRNRIAATLLQSDIIENLGALDNNGEEVPQLATTLAKYIPHPSADIEPAVEDMIAEGLLRRDVSRDGVIWSWAL